MSWVRAPLDDYSYHIKSKTFVSISILNRDKKLKVFDSIFFLYWSSKNDGIKLDNKI